ncbi:MAG: cation-translocating P-type ATPase C-terminal domain-containing protein, partial [Bacillota bacterium]|nr:cation-translocating P-type ATPase C-terminal domain-containing protein [Bacillota bacterium]
YWSSGTLDFASGNAAALAHAQTYAFIVLSLSQLFHALNMRSMTHSVFKVGIFKNMWLIGAIIIGITLQIAVVGIPFLEKAFGTVMPDLRGLLLVAGLSIAPLVIHEIAKLFISMCRAITKREGKKAGV